jgi:hypothetical protein
LFLIAHNMLIITISSHKYALYDGSSNALANVGIILYIIIHIIIL